MKTKFLIGLALIAATHIPTQAFARMRVCSWALGLIKKTPAPPSVDVEPVLAEVDRVLNQLMVSREFDTIIRTREINDEVVAPLITYLELIESYHVLIKETDRDELREVIASSYGYSFSIQRADIPLRRFHYTLRVLNTAAPELVAQFYERLSTAPRKSPLIFPYQYMTAHRHEFVAGKK